MKNAAHVLEAFDRVRSKALVCQCQREKSKIKTHRKKKILFSVFFISDFLPLCQKWLLLFRETFVFLLPRINSPFFFSVSFFNVFKFHTLFIFVLLLFLFFLQKRIFHKYWKMLSRIIFCKLYFYWIWAVTLRRCEAIFYEFILNVINLDAVFGME